MAKLIKLTTVITLVLTVIFALSYRQTDNGILLSIAITFGTVCYHFAMRLAVGSLADMLLHNRVDYNKRRFRVGKGELRLYKFLKVRKWKGKMPTYDPDVFDPKKKSWDEIAQATCQSEIVHELIILLSFLPILASLRFGALPVFVITSFLAALIDCAFVIIQRYNRPYLIRVARRCNRQKESSGKKDGLDN